MNSPEDFLLAAHQLPSGVEAFDRSAVSRLYYCVFHEARAFLTARSRNPDALLPLEGEGSHEQVCRLLTEVNRDAGDLLRALKDRRVKADYPLGAAWSDRERPQTMNEVTLLRRTVFETA